MTGPKFDYDAWDRELEESKASPVKSGFADKREPPKPKGAMLPGLARAAAQGVTFGFADEAEAAVRSILPGSGSYREEKDAVNAERAAFADAHPVLSMGTEIGASILTPGAAAKVAPRAMRGLNALMEGTKVGRVLTGGPIRQAATGGALGAAGAADEGVGTSDVIGGAIFGGGLGAAARATGAVARGGGALVRRATDLLGQGDDAVARGRGVVADIAESQGGLPSVLRKLDEQRAVDPNVMVGEAMGRRGMRALRGTNLSGEGADRVADIVADRAATEPFRVAQDIANAMAKKGAPGQVALRKVVDDAAEEASKAAKPLYDAAYEKGKRLLPLLSPEDQTYLRNLMLDEDVNEAFKLGQRIEGKRALRRGGEGRLGPTLNGTAELDENVSLQHLDWIKRGLDDKISAASRAGNNEMAGALRGIRNDIREMAKDAIPEYADALKLWSGKVDFEEAVEGAKDLLNLPAVDLSDAVAQMSPAELKGFQIGATRRLMDMAMTAPNGQAARNLLNKDMQEKIRTIVGDGEQAGKLIGLLQQRAGLRKTGEFMAGANTANKAADAADVDAALDFEGEDLVDSVMGRMARGGGLRSSVVGTGMQNFSRAVDRARSGATGAGRAEIGRILTASGADADRALADLLDQNAGVQFRRALEAGATAPGLGQTFLERLPGMRPPRPGYGPVVGNLTRMAFDQDN